MDIEMIAAMLEDALQSSLENGIRAVRGGQIEEGLESLERGYAKATAVLDALRAFHSPSGSGRSSLP